jgi:plasmid stabilization system protein ParE
MNVRFLTLAQKEVDDSVHWYDQQANLGRDFLDELDRAVRLIKGHPLASTEIESGIRRCLLHRFPYALIYGID